MDNLLENIFEVIAKRCNGLMLSETKEEKFKIISNTSRNLQSKYGKITLSEVEVFCNICDGFYIKTNQYYHIALDNEELGCFKVENIRCSMCGDIEYAYDKSKINEMEREYIKAIEEYGLCKMCLCKLKNNLLKHNKQIINIE